MVLPVGIDLGTTNSVIAVFDKGRPVPVPVAGRLVTPSAVQYSSESDVRVGVGARTAAGVMPDRVALSIKRHMGEEGFTFDVDGLRHTPEDVSAEILRFLANGAAETLGDVPREAVISVPAYFEEPAKRATAEAGRAAGLSVLRIMPEPVAAAISYGFKGGKDQRLLVYDLGGGTFDVSVLRVYGEEYHVEAYAGNRALGGDDLDRILTERLMEAFQVATGVHLDMLPDDDPDVVRARALLRQAAERAKIDLSDAEEVPVLLPNLYAGNTLDTTLTRAELEDLFRPLLEPTVPIALEAMAKAGVGPGDIDRVLLVGGSTRIPLVHELARSITGRTPYTTIDPALSVALGAAIMAAQLTLPARDRPLKAVSLRTPHTLGIKIVDLSTGQIDCFSPIIPANSELPATGDDIYTTVDDYQSAITISVYQGESLERCSETNHRLGEFVLDGIEKAPMGVPQVEVTFTLSEDDILSVAARDLRTSAHAGISIKRTDSGTTPA